MIDNEIQMRYVRVPKGLYYLAEDVAKYIEALAHLEETDVRNRLMEAAQYFKQAK